MPDEYKMKEIMQDSDKYCAYACQCTWQSVKNLKEIKPGGGTVSALRERVARHRGPTASDRPRGLTRLG